MPDFISDWLWENWKTMFNGPTITLFVILHRRVGSEIVGGARVIMFALAMWVYGAYFHSQLVANYVWLYLCCVVFQTVSRWVEARCGDHTISISSGLWALDYLKNCPDWLRSSWVVDVVIEPALIFMASRFIANWDGPFAFLIGWGALGMVPMQFGRYATMARMQRDARDAILVAQQQAAIQAAEQEKYQRYLAGQQQALWQQTMYQDPNQGGPYYQNPPAQPYPVQPGPPKSNAIVEIFHSVKDSMVAAKETAAEKRRTVEAVTETVHAAHDALGTFRDAVGEVHQTAHAVTHVADAYRDAHTTAPQAYSEQPEHSDELPVIDVEFGSPDMGVPHVEPKQLAA